jgi:hypothetical protein
VLIRTSEFPALKRRVTKNSARFSWLTGGTRGVIRNIVMICHIGPTAPLLAEAAFKDAVKASWRASPALQNVPDGGVVFDLAVALTRAHGKSMILTDNDEIEETS